MDQKSSPADLPKDKESISALIGSKLESAGNIINTGEGDEASKRESNYFSTTRRREYSSLSWIFIVFVWAAGLAFVLVAFSRIIHLILPETGSIGVVPFHKWLTAEQIQEIDRVLFSGSIGGILGGYFKDKIKPS